MGNFKLIEIFLEDVGLYRPTAINVSKHKYLVVLSFLWMSSILSGIPISKLRSLNELAKACFGWFTIVIIAGVDAGLISQTSNIYIFIDETRELIQKREFQETT